MTLAILAWAALAFAALPALLFLANLKLYTPPEAADEPGSPSISILVPARNEEAAIAACVGAALAATDCVVEVVVLDDHSEDGTAKIVAAMAARDPRVRLVSAPHLPPGWCGKQHACHVLSQHARYDLLLFLDADVRLAPDGPARLAAFLRRSGADLVSGVPLQETKTLGEKLLIPLIHFVLLGFLPIARMRQSRDPAFGSGCGQLFLARKDAYHEAGGHEAIKTSLHDGIKLPRAFRAAGKTSDICDATPLATCRMYRGFAQTWRGLAKNATEGLGSPGMILPATLLLGLGQVTPFVLLAFAGEMTAATLAVTVAACGFAYLPRVMGVVRFGQSVMGAVLHPLGVALLLAVQWYALGRKLVGAPAGWKGRTYSSTPLPPRGEGGRG